MKCVNIILPSAELIIYNYVRNRVVGYNNFRLVVENPLDRFIQRNVTISILNTTIRRNEKEMKSIRHLIIYRHYRNPLESFSDRGLD